MRLCVETLLTLFSRFSVIAAASVRLCVETSHSANTSRSIGAAASVRLCVETSVPNEQTALDWCSRLRAAVC